MTHRERVRAILHYESVDRIPIVAFGYWAETLQKWHAEGYITREECEYGSRDNSSADRQIMDKLGFDFNWSSTLGGRSGLFPSFEPEVLSREADGSLIERNSEGLIVRRKPGVVSIPSEIGTTLTDRAAWEEYYLPRLQYCEERIPVSALKKAKEEDETRQLPLGLDCGSLYGSIRNLTGVEQLAYLPADDEDLYEEIIHTWGNLAFRVVKRILDFGIRFDYAHFWEDICFKNGPLIHPEVFRQLIGPHYKQITDELSLHGIDIVSVDCDGWIDLLVPSWIENGVNTMFPIEVGTWNASLAPWRKTYGKRLRGVGGMNKCVFSQDKAAVDREIERLRPLVEMGGYIPCPDHRIPPDAEFKLVAYYCEQFRKVFD